MTNKPLGIYAHIPYCKSRCAYCSFVSGTDCSNQKLYTDALINEISLRAKELTVACDFKPIADTVYIGGGTPSMLRQGYLGRILFAVKSSFDILSDAEITVESNPDSANTEFLNECATAGVNRISFGVQSAHDKILKSVNRPHSFADFITAARAARGVGIKNISADVMLGLPFDTVKGVKESVNRILEQGVSHVSAYALKVEEGTPLYFDGFNADEDLQAEMYDTCYSTLKSAGFLRYEVSNFSLPNYESKHNLKYWRRLPYVGLGVAAHSFIGGVRQENTDNISKYILGESVRQCTKISDKDAIEEYIMLGLRTSGGIDLGELKRDYGYDLLQIKSEQISRLEQLNAIKRYQNRIILEDSAFYIMNSVIIELI